MNNHNRNSPGNSSHPLHGYGLGATGNITVPSNLENIHLRRTIQALLNRSYQLPVLPPQPLVLPITTPPPTPSPTGTLDISQNLINVTEQSCTVDSVFTPNTREGTATTSNHSNFIIIDTPTGNIQERKDIYPRKRTRTELEIESVPDEVENPLQDNYVYQVLMGHDEGEHLMAAYNFQKIPENEEKLLKEKKVLYFKPTKVAKILVLHEFRRTNSFTIPPERFLQFAESCKPVFPTILTDKFYIPAGSKSAGGALQVFYIKQREKEIFLGRLPLKQGTPKKPAEVDKKKKVKVYEELIEPVEIFDEAYKQKWRKTGLLERVKFCKNVGKLDDVFKELPNLGNPAGYQLIQVDFEELHERSSHDFATRWATLAPLIVRIARKDPKEADLIQILSANAAISNEEHENTLALMVLPYIFNRNVKLRQSKTQSTWNPSYAEIATSFINHIQPTDEIDASLDEIRSNVLRIFNNRKLPIDPFVVIVGSSLSLITSAYVVIGAHTYQFNTAVEAVDISFQFCKLFRKEYNRASNHVYEFLESEVYDLNVPKPYQSVVNLKQKINALRERDRIVAEPGNN